MRYLRAKVKAKSGERLTVEFSEPTRVLIMTDNEFKKYKNHNTFTYFGGEKESPFEFTIPKSTSWNVVVEKGSYYSPRPITAKVIKSSGSELAQAAEQVAAPKKKKKSKKGKKDEIAEELKEGPEHIDDETKGEME